MATCIPVKGLDLDRLANSVALPVLAGTAPDDHLERTTLKRICPWLQTKFAMSARVN